MASSNIKKHDQPVLQIQPIVASNAQVQPANDSQEYLYQLEAQNITFRKCFYFIYI